MKTPREILFRQHESAKPKLDSIRRGTVEKLNNKETKEQSSIFVSLLLCCPRIVWRELIWPVRRAWVGFAFMWLVIAAVNVANSDQPTAKQAKIKPAPINMMLAWQQQQQLLADFNNERADSDKPKPVAPKPRSDAQSLLPMA